MNTYPKITFTMTCGRRLKLFIETMDSFLNCCWDLDLIEDWFVSDDRSTEEALADMRERYPFLKIFSSPRPGQAASLNFLFSMVETEWFFHCEDDWRFTMPGHFIREALDVGLSDNQIRNVVLRGWDGVYVRDGRVEFRGHVLNLQGMKHENLDWGWHGYSLNPGLQHKPTVTGLGPYDETIMTRFFDRPAAENYRAWGLKRANLTKPYILHIGEETPAHE